MNIPFEMTSTMDRYYEAERNVALRKKVIAKLSLNSSPHACTFEQYLIYLVMQGEKLEYLVLWSDDYPKEQASWVRHKDVTPALLRYT